MPQQTTSTTDREVAVTLYFDAPRSIVFNAMTRPEYVRRWYGPRGTELTVCDIDLRVGGRYRFVMQGPDGSEHGFSGVFREIVPNERIVQTWGYEAMPGHESIESAEFSEEDGRTRVDLKTVFQSAEDKAGWAQSGGQEGMKQSHERLEELVQELAG